MSDKEISNKVAKNILSLDLSSDSEIDLSDLPAETREELVKYAAMKKIDLKSSAMQMQMDLQVTDTAVDNMADAARKMAASGDSVTIRQKIDNQAGSVEILMGNTEEARQGKTNPGPDKTGMFLAAGVALAIIIAIVLT